MNRVNARAYRYSIFLVLVNKNWRAGWLWDIKSQPDDCQASLYSNIPAFFYYFFQSMICLHGIHGCEGYVIWQYQFDMKCDKCFNPYMKGVVGMRRKACSLWQWAKRVMDDGKQQCMHRICTRQKRIILACATSLWNVTSKIRKSSDPRTILIGLKSWSLYINFTLTAWRYVMWDNLVLCAASGN